MYDRLISFQPGWQDEFLQLRHQELEELMDEFATLEGLCKIDADKCGEAVELCDERMTYLLITTGKSWEQYLEGCQPYIQRLWRDG